MSPQKTVTVPTGPHIDDDTTATKCWKKVKTKKGIGLNGNGEKGKKLQKTATASRSCRKG
jgi:hypothetical protein